MCGISGFINFEENFLNKQSFFENILDNMRKSLNRRGSDANGIYLDNHFGASHSRLSIRDLSENGNQPMIKIINDNKYIIVYNGEIYNVDELKIELKNKGYSFSTTTDTEVILNLFIEYKEKCVDYLNGIFAFSIYDTQEETLYLFRDRVGVKPLFYTINNKTLVFGSEPKAIFEYPNITPTIDIDSLKQILSLGPARIAGKGVFKDLFEIKPGHFGIFNKYGFKEIQYWELKSDYHTDSYEQTVEKVSFLVRDAIERQLVSDVEICTFLSGGIDSSIVTAVSSKYLSKFNKKLNTFSFDFKENDIYFKSNSFQPERDKPYVDIMLNNYDLNHNYLECNEQNLVSLLYEAVDAKDLPGMADVDASMLYFCSLVSKQNKVALTGECADEIFGGYPWFYREDLLNSTSFPWSKNMDTRELFLQEDLKIKLNLSEYSLQNYENSIKETPYLYGENKEECRRREIAYLNIKWFMSTLLERMDRMSMYNGLEARVPFADHRIIEYLWNVPWDMKYKNNIEKGLLRDATKDLLPNELLNRKKSPYPKTYNPNYEKLLINELTSIINNNNLPINDLIDKNKVLEFVKMPTNYDKPWFGQLMSGPQLMAYFIQINYWLDKYHLKINI
ncbi:asparagine synthase (glutamine-hydrolyzing) [[Clostridium] colinum]|uniref:asparagine synthase (glutamine-hydrolyzing) n=1 Tax=[Clostridium] colinum TaxID=36835 RepID=UPI0020246C3D|nr:asparagine synthase (glutamine-hydrolyzing) [[Clostridium] colinum]